MTAAVAVFVKTPGVTPLKTRLEAGVGQHQALEFYRLSCAAIEETLKSSVKIAPYWSVAEQGVKDHWPSFTNIPQGDGGLGDRLFLTYSQLLKSHPVVVLLGADCPQLPVSWIEDAVEHCKSTGEFVFGPAEDGGFYLFAGSSEISLDIWTSVSYSCSDTLATLKNKLKSIAPSRELSTLTDVDTLDDLSNFSTELEEIIKGYGETAGRKNLALWLEKIAP